MKTLEIALTTAEERAVEAMAVHAVMGAGSSTAGDELDAALDLELDEAAQLYDSQVAAMLELADWPQEAPNPLLAGRLPAPPADWIGPLVRWAGSLAFGSRLASVCSQWALVALPVAARVLADRRTTWWDPAADTALGPHGDDGPPVWAWRPQTDAQAGAFLGQAVLSSRDRRFSRVDPAARPRPLAGVFEPLAGGCPVLQPSPWRAGAPVVALMCRESGMASPAPIMSRTSQPIEQPFTIVLVASADEQATGPLLSSQDSRVQISFSEPRPTDPLYMRRNKAPQPGVCMLAQPLPSPPAKTNTPVRPTCAAGHLLEPFVVLHPALCRQLVKCDVCELDPCPIGTRMRGCSACDFDCCEACAWANDGPGKPERRWPLPTPPEAQRWPNRKGLWADCTAGAPHVLCCGFNGDRSWLRVDGALAGIGDVGDAPLDGLVLGATSGNEFGDGCVNIVAELVVIKGELEPTDLAIIERQLMDKHNVLGEQRRLAERDLRGIPKQLSAEQVQNLLMTGCAVQKLGYVEEEEQPVALTAEERAEARLKELQTQLFELQRQMLALPRKQRKALQKQAEELEARIHEPYTEDSSTMPDSPGDDQAMPNLVQVPPPQPPQPEASQSASRAARKEADARAESAKQVQALCACAADGGAQAKMKPVNDMVSELKQVSHA